MEDKIRKWVDKKNKIIDIFLLYFYYFFNINNV